jgi:hypothetical protein
MKTNLTHLLLIFCLGLSFQSFAQTPDLDKKTQEIKAKHKAKDLVLEMPISIFKDSTSFSGSFFLPKHKYIIYAIADNEAIKKTTFTLRFEAMKGKMENEEDQNREKIGTGWKMYKEFVCKPRVIETQIANVEFKMNDVTALSNTMMSKSSAEYGGGSSYTKYKNGCLAKIKFEIAKEDFLREYDRQVKILVFER